MTAIVVTAVPYFDFYRQQVPWHRTSSSYKLTSSNDESSFATDDRTCKIENLSEENKKKVSVFFCNRPSIFRGSFALHIGVTESVFEVCVTGAAPKKTLPPP
jgi:hypothetical protein